MWVLSYTARAQDTVVWPALAERYATEYILRNLPLLSVAKIQG